MPVWCQWSEVKTTEKKKGSEVQQCCLHEKTKQKQSLYPATALICAAAARTNLLTSCQGVSFSEDSLLSSHLPIRKKSWLVAESKQIQISERNQSRWCLFVLFFSCCPCLWTLYFQYPWADCLLVLLCLPVALRVSELWPLYGPFMAASLLPVHWPVPGRALFSPAQPGSAHIAELYGPDSQSH